MYKVFLSKQAEKSIKELQTAYKEKIILVLKNLEKNPFYYPYKKIRGEEKLYRVRVGIYQIIYEIEQDKSVIYIIKISSREKAYK